VGGVFDAVLGGATKDPRAAKSGPQEEKDEREEYSDEYSKEGKGAWGKRGRRQKGGGRKRLCWPRGVPRKQMRDGKGTWTSMRRRRRSILQRREERGRGGGEESDSSSGVPLRRTQTRTGRAPQYTQEEEESETQGEESEGSEMSEEGEGGMTQMGV